MTPSRHDSTLDTGLMLSYSFSKEPSPIFPVVGDSVSLQHGDRWCLYFQGVTHGDTPIKCLCVGLTQQTLSPPLEAAATLEIPEANALRSLHFQQLLLNLPWWLPPIIVACRRLRKNQTLRPGLAPQQDPVTKQQTKANFGCGASW